MTKSFMTTNRFFDNKNYPRGFSRYGDFTIKEAQLLELYGCAFNDLESGRREPVTKDEKLFVEVCRGERKPMTDVERVWVKYISKIKHPKRFHTLSGSKFLQVENNEDYIELDD